jgi:hypothetical protein
MCEGFEKMTVEFAQSFWAWGHDLVPGSTAYRRLVGDTEMWVGKTDEAWVCEIHAESELVGEEVGDTPYDAMLNGVIDSVVDRAVREEWDEPRKQGLKASLGDVVEAMAYYGYEVIRYGWERLDELFPNTAEGCPRTREELRLLDDLRGRATTWVALRMRA